MNRSAITSTKPERVFVTDRWTYGQVYALAENIVLWSASLPAGISDICLRIEDRGLFAAALAAGMHIGPRLIVPNAYSDRVLAELHERVGYGAAIADSSDGFPAGVRVFTPRAADLSAGLRSISADVDRQRVFIRIFTGGSTGKPCIWPKTIGNLFGEARYLSRRFGVLSSDRFLATVPPYHIYGMLYSVLIPFVSGASVAADMPIYPQEIADTADRRAASALVGVPIHYRMLKGRTFRRRTLRMAFSSASPLDAADDRAFFLQTGAPIHDVFGSTETGGVASRCRAFGQEAFAAFEPVAWKIRREHLFVKSPFASPELDTDPQGYARTGDRVQRIDDAGFNLKSRTDGIVKIGGKRVDLERVREILLRCASIEDAIVLAEDDPFGRGSRLVALIQGEVADKANVRRQLLSHLDAAAVPRRMIFVKRLPVKATGKYDREAIRALMKS